MHAVVAKASKRCLYCRTPTLTHCQIKFRNVQKGHQKVNQKTKENAITIEKIKFLVSHTDS